MEKQKMKEVSITALKITAEDDFLIGHISSWGASIRNSPHYMYLIGIATPMLKWMDMRKLDQDYHTKKLIELLVDIAKNGQKEPIKIYKDGRINTGHKRTACMLYLGYKKIKAEIVPDNYKL